VLRWLADENFNNDILRVLFRRSAGLDIVRAQDVGLAGTDDATILAWAAKQNRLLLTHDVSTITAHAYQRVVNGEPMPGVFELRRGVSLSSAVDDILLLTECSNPGEWEGQVRYLPFR
jgi:predicted nuclease of predicted toxin-antitoxin system